MQYGIVLKAKEWECVKLCNVAIIARHIPFSIIFLKETVIFKKKKKTKVTARIRWHLYTDTEISVIGECRLKMISVGLCMPVNERSCI